MTRQKKNKRWSKAEIAQLEEMLRNAVIIKDDGADNSVVAIGKTVTFFIQEDIENETYTIVGGAAEADPFTGKISNESPIAKSLLGRSVGDVVTVQNQVATWSSKSKKSNKTTSGSDGSRSLSEEEWL